MRGYWRMIFWSIYFGAGYLLSILFVSVYWLFPIGFVVGLVSEWAWKVATKEPVEEIPSMFKQRSNCNNTMTVSELYDKVARQVDNLQNQQSAFFPSDIPTAYDLKIMIVKKQDVLMRLMHIAIKEGDRELSQEELIELGV